MKFSRETATAILRELLTTNKAVTQIEGISREDFVFHVDLLRDCRLIEADIDHDLNSYSAIRVTWDGYSRLWDFDVELGKEFDLKQFVRQFPRF